MTASEVLGMQEFHRQAYLRMIERIINPPVLYFQDRLFIAQGQIITATVPHPSLREMQQTLEPIVTDWGWGPEISLKGPS